ncbi:MAG: MBL fold metallo-hydrolase [Candidatus Shapirobacteria bacterium]|nr:MBL fold metallo-hydrolase [Candidatus Shapirobacteria bacterium]MDD3002657.1 MBL fold metallo-hydrolase [Candidatus Shapirobacteria bacterium]MDD4382838.1 MBL fold metallo-hydrolase [Candidatus Shapirobacteria bacterium]
MKIRIILFLSLMALVVIFWLTLPSQKVNVIFCDVGQGDATLVTYKNWQMLIDTGPNNKRVLTCLEKNVPFWDKKIEVVMITHGDNDHSGGLTDVSKFYQIEQIIDSKKVSQFDLIKTNWMEFEVVNPREKVKEEKDNNENAIAGILKFYDTKLKKEIKVFMAADIDLETEQRLVWQTVLRQDSGTVNILKVSHHGSKNGTSKELLELLKPKIAVISVGAKNKFGHPTKEVLNKLKEKGVEIWRTDLNGEISTADLHF